LTRRENVQGKKRQKKKKKKRMKENDAPKKKKLVKRESLGVDGGTAIAIPGKRGEIRGKR